MKGSAVNNDLGMSNRFARPSGATTTRYRIVVRGNITSRFLAALRGADLEAAGEESSILVDIRDQPHLHGVLRWLEDRGVEIVSINPLAHGPGP